MELEHFLHGHALKSCEKIVDEGELICVGCEKLLSGQAYGCSACEFFLHKSCSELPEEIRVFFHPCPLVLRISTTFVCEACYLYRSGFVYCCRKCGFNLDVECAQQPTSKSDGEEEQIQHFSHLHALTIYQKLEDVEVYCQLCEKVCVDHTCACRQCKFYLHKSCMGILAPKIQHLFHPCSLILLSTVSYWCDACYKPCTGLNFSCGQCHFKLCIECSLLPTIESDGHEKIQHSLHGHPLTFAEKNEEILCHICNNSCLAPAYSCSRCNFHLHKSCMDILPHKIQHLFHPCPLKLFTTSHFRCGGCDKVCLNLTFRCCQCYFDLCVECSLLPTIKSDNYERIQHFLHRHPLTLLKMEEVGEVCCQACGKRCSSPTYYCNRCNFFLHKSCAELPQEIQSMNHPSHPLTLLNITFQNPKKLRCSLCLKDCRRFAFRCDKCDCQLDVECAFLRPSIKFMDHTHFLTVVDNIYGEIECNACNASCLGSPAFRCHLCNFSLHLECGPLPTTIKHKCHVDALTLQDLFIEHEDDDEFYCDACEQPRDPRICVYHCAEGCAFISHVKCVISEVLASLRGDRGDVELRTVGRQVTSIVISKDSVVKQDETHSESGEENAQFDIALSLDDILDSLNEFEIKEIEIIQSRHVSDCQAIMVREIDSDKEKLQRVFAYSEESFAKFMERFDLDVLGNRIPDFIEKHNEFVNVGNNLVFPRTLMPTFKNLLATYGDISAESSSWTRVRSLVFFFLCAVIESMRTTLVVDLTEHRFCQWLTCLKFVKHAGFKVEFMFDQMERIAQAHFGLQVRKFLDDTPAAQDKEIEHVSKEIEELAVKLEATRAKLDAMKEEQEYHRTSAKSAAKTRFMKQCFSHALALKWRPAAYGLF